MGTSEVVGFEDVTVGDEGSASKKKPAKKSGGFNCFAVSPDVLKGIQKRGYKTPTPIQRKVIFFSNIMNRRINNIVIIILLLLVLLLLSGLFQLSMPSHFQYFDYPNSIRVCRNVLGHSE